MKKMISTKFRLFLLIETNSESFHLALTFFEKTKKTQKNKQTKKNTKIPGQVPIT